jgi:hypothetical protein
MPTESCLIVFAAGKQLDLLRGEASRIAKRNNVDWWSDRVQIGTRFCFADSNAKKISGSPATISAYPAETASQRKNPGDRAPGLFEPGALRNYQVKQWILSSRRSCL